MNFKEVEVSDSRGKMKRAILAECFCGGDTFSAFQIEGTRHLHLQCGKCGVSFCPAGNCNNEADVE